MPSAQTWITAVFVVVAVVLWYLSGFVTDSVAIRYGLLIGVGLILPVMVNEVRNRQS